MAKIILGISLGTRMIGLVLFRNGEMIDYRIKAFRGKWCKSKELLILRSLKQFYLFNRVKVIGIKIPNPLRSSVSLERLYHRVISEARSMDIKIHSFSLTDLKQVYGMAPTIRKVKLVVAVTERHPELRNLALKNSNSLTSYYERIFEAVASVEAIT